MRSLVVSDVGDLVRDGVLGMLGVVGLCLDRLWEYREGDRRAATKSVLSGAVCEPGFHA